MSLRLTVCIRILVQYYSEHQNTCSCMYSNRARVLKFNKCMHDYYYYYCYYCYDYYSWYDYY